MSQRAVNHHRGTRSRYQKEEKVKTGQASSHRYHLSCHYHGRHERQYHRYWLIHRPLIRDENHRSDPRGSLFPKGSRQETSSPSPSPRNSRRRLRRPQRIRNSSKEQETEAEQEETKYPNYNPWRGGNRRRSDLSISVSISVAVSVEGCFSRFDSSIVDPAVAWCRDRCCGVGYGWEAEEVEEV